MDELTLKQIKSRVRYLALPSLFGVSPHLFFARKSKIKDRMGEACVELWSFSHHVRSNPSEAYAFDEAVREAIRDCRREVFFLYGLREIIFMVIILVGSFYAFYSFGEDYTAIVKYKNIFIFIVICLFINLFRLYEIFKPLLNRNLEDRFIEVLKKKP